MECLARLLNATSPKKNDVKKRNIPKKKNLAEKKTSDDLLTSKRLSIATMKPLTKFASAKKIGKLLFIVS